MKCPKCDLTNREGAQYCLNCGERLIFECLQCGTILPLNAKFCDTCGQNYENLARSKKDRDTLDTLAQCLGHNNISFKEAKKQFERLFFEKKLQEFNWNISKAAEAIGIERSNLHKKIKSYKLEHPKKKIRI